MATGVVERVKFEEYDGDVHVNLRPDDKSRRLLSDGNRRAGGNLVVEIIPDPARKSESQGGEAAAQPHPRARS